MILATISRIGSPANGVETVVVLVVLPAEVGAILLVVDGISSVVVATGVPTSAPIGTVTLFELDTQLFKAELYGIAELPSCPNCGKVSVKLCN
jgi:hypothetical protein